MGNKRKCQIEEGESSKYSDITDADLVRSDFEEYRGLGSPSVDSHTM